MVPTSFFFPSFHLWGTFCPVCAYLPAHSSPLFHCPHPRFLLQARIHIPASEIFPGLCSAHRFNSSSQSLLAPEIYRNFPPLSKALRLASFFSHPSPVLSHVDPLWEASWLLTDCPKLDKLVLLWDLALQLLVPPLWYPCFSEPSLPLDVSLPLGCYLCRS